MSSPTLTLEWFYETLNKRVGPPFNLKLNDLFCVIPHSEESEHEYDILTPFKNKYTAQGNNLRRDYPNLAKLADSEVKRLKIRIFFVHSSRLAKPVVLHHKKYNYPSVSSINGTRSPLLIN